MFYLRVLKQWFTLLTFINRADKNNAYAYGWELEFPNKNGCSTIGPGNFKKCSANNLSIDLLISNSHRSSMYTLSIVWPLFKLVLHVLRGTVHTALLYLYYRQFWGLLEQIIVISIVIRVGNYCISFEHPKRIISSHWNLLKNFDSHFFKNFLLLRIVL